MITRLVTKQEDIILAPTTTQTTRVATSLHSEVAQSSCNTDNLMQTVCEATLKAYRYLANRVL